MTNKLNVLKVYRAEVLLYAFRVRGQSVIVLENVIFDICAIPRADSKHNLAT
jgi:hypothetical protein